MKKMILKTVLLLILTTSAYAQTAPAELFKVNEDLTADNSFEIPERALIGEFNVNDDADITVNNQQYISLKINQDIRMNRLALGLNLLGDAAAAYGVFKVNPSNDKLRHGLAGYIVGNFTTGAMQLLLPDNTKNRKLKALLIGFGASLLVGAGREWYDSNSHGQVDFNDFVVTGAGGLVGTLTISIGDGKKALRKTTN
jgi:hypothetical protein